MMFENGTPEQAQNLYIEILSVANHFLASAKRYEMSALQDFNPSFLELAEIMKDLASIIRGLADEIDPTLSNKALDYAEAMSRMALAISQGDSISLNEGIDSLESKPFV